MFVFNENNCLFIKLVKLASLCLLMLVSGFAAAKTEVRQPNVLFIMVDDLNAWVGNLKKHPLAHTPNIDKLAASSVSLTNTHSAAPVCAASRAAFMSGVYPHKSGLYSNAGHNTST